MKQFIIGLLILSFLPTQAQEKYSIVASASIFMDMAQHIVGDLHTVDLIVPIGGDPHVHTPTPRDAQLVTEADLILINAMTFEGWIDELIENSGSKAVVKTITEGINALESDKYKNSADPHAWMDASNGLVYIKNIYDAVVQMDPKNKAIYSANYENYKNEVSSLDDYITNAIRKIPLDKRVLITSHDAFAYYGQRYGIRVEALMGISTEAAAQTSDMVRVNKVIRENKVPAIFVESTINPKLINQIAKDNNVKIGGELFADSIGDEESEGNGYLEMLRHNTDTIVNALTNNNVESIASKHNHPEEVKNNLLLYLLAGLLLIGGLILAIYKINR